MASTFSFDVVSDFDRQELVNALDQVRRELKSRYDLKDTKTTLDLGETNISIETASEMTLEAVHTLIQTKAAKRNLSMKIFEFGNIEAASGNRVRQNVELKKGLSQEVAKKISKMIRDNLKKYKPLFKEMRSEFRPNPKMTYKARFNWSSKKIGLLPCNFRTIVNYR